MHKSELWPQASDPGEGADVLVPQEPFQRPSKPKAEGVETINLSDDRRERGQTGTPPPKVERMNKPCTLSSQRDISQGTVQPTVKGPLQSGQFLSEH